MTFQIGQKVVVSAQTAEVVAVEKKTVTVKFADGSVRRCAMMNVTTEIEFAPADPNAFRGKIESVEQAYAAKFRRFGGSV